MQAEAVVPPDDEPEPLPAPELLAAPPLDPPPEDPELLLLPPVEPSKLAPVEPGELEEGPGLLPEPPLQAARPVENARPEMVKKKRRRDCICLLRSPNVPRVRPYGSTRRE
jgi:hypothetical protein